jgi:predicted site-specific integrase-resolvase
MPTSPALLALQDWRNQVAKLEAWEQEEIEEVYQKVNALLHHHQSSAALAVVRASLEIGLLQGQ